MTPNSAAKLSNNVLTMGTTASGGSIRDRDCPAERACDEGNRKAEARISARKRGLASAQAVFLSLVGLRAPRRPLQIKETLNS